MAKPTPSAYQARIKAKRVTARLNNLHVDGARARKRAEDRITCGGRPRGSARFTARKARRLAEAGNVNFAWALRAA